MATLATRNEPQLDTDIEGTRTNSGDLRGPASKVKVDLGRRQTLTVRCIAGHTWEHEVGATKRAGKVCPMHEKFFKRGFEKSNSPPDRVLNEWQHCEENQVTEVGYAARWRALWRRVVRIVAARQNSWSVDMVMIEKYVWHLRWAELHRLYAQDEPYVTTSNGALREHPGWKLAEAEDKRARAIALELGIEEPERNFRGISNEKPAKNAGKSSRPPTNLEQEAGEREDEIVDSQVGPDGVPL